MTARLRLPLLLLALSACATADSDVSGWEQQADRITITRDDWGIAHVHGPTDADAVFGMIYAQAEDDFPRVERNYLLAMGRVAEADGEEAVIADLRMKLFISPDSLRVWYDRSPDDLKALMDAWAAGLNWYLHTHPEVTPLVITRFEPWMALSFTEGSIGGDIESISLAGLRRFYDSTSVTVDDEASSGDGGWEPLLEPTGSNGFAIAPSHTAGGHALLLINPHTSFFVRSELQMTSDEGLNAYGAVTWGQFFIYQGFNATAGWMHTSSGVDNIDYWRETVVQEANGLGYRYGTEVRPMMVETITVPFRADTGMASRQFTVYRTHHGPVVAGDGEHWLTVRLMQDPINALAQSYGRTRARNFAEFRETMERHTNSSNNTLFADAEGNIAYLHSNFVPRRDPAFDWTRPVDGSDPATEWQGVHTFDETPNVVNPSTGWVQNTNNWPWSAAGDTGPRKEDYPPYFESGTENARGIHAMRVLRARDDFTLATLIEAAFDRDLPAFDELIPPLVAAWDREPARSARKARLAEPIAMLRDWDRRWGVESVETAVAVFWGTELLRRRRETGDGPGAQLDALVAALDRLEADFGSWRTPWGEINRFQRISPAIVHPFADSAPSIPVGFTAGTWGSLASFGTRRWQDQKRLYGTSGNSFVAVVEFGDSVRARAVTAGGESGDPASPHFNDQAERYATGNLREVYFYPNQLEGHIERRYSPGR